MEHCPSLHRQANDHLFLGPKAQLIHSETRDDKAETNHEKNSLRLILFPKTKHILKSIMSTEMRCKQGYVTRQII